MSRTQIKILAITVLVTAMVLLPTVVTLAGWISGGGD